MSQDIKGKKSESAGYVADGLFDIDAKPAFSVDYTLDEPLMNVRTSGAKKTDTGKRRFHLLPVQPLYDAIDVLEFGAARYGDFNWQKGFEYTGIYNAAQRHLHAWLDGEDLADDSKLPHLAHAMVNLMFLLVFRHTHPELDNRLNKHE